MATIIINDIKDLEPYKKEINRSVWKGDEIEFDNYEKIKDGVKSMWEETFEVFSLSSKRDRFANELRFNSRYSNTFKAFIKAQNLVSNLPTKEMSKNEVKEIYDNAFKEINSFVKEFGEEEFISEYRQNLFIDATNFLIKHNKYEYEKQEYYEFFADPNAEYKNYLKFSEQNPAENTLILNCEIEKIDAVFDVYGNLEANKNLHCSFLGVCGKVKGKEITCDAMYAEELEAEKVVCTPTNGIEYHHLDEMTFPKDIQDAIVQGANPNKFFGDDITKYDMIIGKMNVYDQSKEAPFKININNDLYSFKFGTHIDMVGGKVKVNTLFTQNAFLGDTEAKEIKITGEAFLGTDIVNKKISSLSDKQLKKLVSLVKKNPNRTTIVPTDDFYKNGKKNLKMESGMINGIQCNKLESTSLISSRYVNSQEVNISSFAGTSILANKINADWLQAKTLTANEIKTKKLAVADILRAGTVFVSKEMELPEGDKIAGNFKLTKEVLKNSPDEVKKVLGLDKPKPLTAKKINKSGMDK